ncbi:amidohydrolase family protein [Microbacterium rhizomatis]|uniref:Amidohydrolase family protein n=1 Tax=Microbacterium rhizomatis TaxID=1631477 RepID=A0A5J5J2D8_9MICO|nr:hypothetical protein [Microbacterium rhizomatis]KAA9106468.1 hypothetical protein F6B43_15100 [Microbacterium rhizomatis]
MPHPDPATVQALLGSHAVPCRRGVAGPRGIALPPFLDHHVHLHLVDESPLPAHGIAGVVDLGGDPLSFARRPHGGMPHVAYAGAFLTAAGGYPSGRSWAPSQTVREVTDPSTRPGVAGGATTAVDEQAECGASVIKIALNAQSGPVFDDALLAAIVRAAHGRGLPVVAHVQGDDTAERAIEAGLDALAHTPFTAILAPDLIERAAARQAWISTLAIHRDDPATHEIAVANLRAFAAAGGRVLYGTDLGNGDLPVGVNPDELAALREAGLDAASIVASLIDPWPDDSADGLSLLAGTSTFVPGGPPTDDDLTLWLALATVVPTEELIHDDL